MNKVYVVGIGPGKPDGMTVEAVRALEQCSIIIGYPVYVDQVRAYFPGKTCLSTPMRQEVRRCRIALAAAEAGNTVAMVCSGDAGVYGMAGLLYELRGEYPGASITVIPGVTAALSGAALLGAPLGHDFCVISLSDLLTPWEQIEKRLRCAAEGDFAVVLYNPASRRRRELSFTSSCRSCPGQRTALAMTLPSFFPSKRQTVASPPQLPMYLP